MVLPRRVYRHKLPRRAVLETLEARNLLVASAHVFVNFDGTSQKGEKNPGDGKHFEIVGLINTALDASDKTKGLGFKFSTPTEVATLKQTILNEINAVYTGFNVVIDATPLSDDSKLDRLVGNEIYFGPIDTKGVLGLTPGIGRNSNAINNGYTMVTAWSSVVSPRRILDALLTGVTNFDKLTAAQAHDRIAKLIANVAVHELGHQFGLIHEDAVPHPLPNPKFDLMSTGPAGNQDISYESANTLELSSFERAKLEFSNVIGHSSPIGSPNDGAGTGAVAGAAAYAIPTDKFKSIDLPSGNEAKGGQLRAVRIVDYIDDASNGSRTYSVSLQEGDLISLQVVSQWNGNNGSTTKTPKRGVVDTRLDLKNLDTNAAVDFSKQFYFPKEDKTNSPNVTVTRAFDLTVDPFLPDVKITSNGKYGITVSREKENDTTNGMFDLYVLIYRAPLVKKSSSNGWFKPTGATGYVSGDGKIVTPELGGGWTYDYNVSGLQGQGDCAILGNMA